MIAARVTVVAASFSAIVWLFAAMPAAAAPLEAFFGRFVGESVEVEGEGVSERDFDVVIKPRDKRGFVLTWTTLSRRDDGTLKKKSYTIEFRATEREGIYGSAEEKDMFGNKVPRDPLKGEPYAWARLKDDTLTVFALLITDSGGYEIQEYHRTLIDSGLKLDFRRLRNGEPLKRITGILNRVEE